MAPREILLNAILVRGMNKGRSPQAATALSIFGLAEVAATGAGAQDFAARCDLEALGDRFLRFDAFGTSHKFNSSC
jgi:hypothetical protein